MARGSSIEVKSHRYPNKVHNDWWYSTFLLRISVNIFVLFIMICIIITNCCVAFCNLYKKKNIYSVFILLIIAVCEINGYYYFSCGQTLHIHYLVHYRL